MSCFNVKIGKTTLFYWNCHQVIFVRNIGVLLAESMRLLVSICLAFLYQMKMALHTGILYACSISCHGNWEFNFCRPIVTEMDIESHSLCAVCVYVVIWFGDYKHICIHNPTCLVHFHFSLFWFNTLPCHTTNVDPPSKLLMNAIHNIYWHIIFSKFHQTFHGNNELSPVYCRTNS